MINKDSSFFHLEYKPKLKNPIYIIGVSGVGNVGRVSTQLLIEWSRAKFFSSFYSYYFLDQALIQNDGICNLPKWDFYESGFCYPNLIICVGNSKIAVDESEAYYILLNKILDFGLKFKIKKLIIVDGVAALSNYVKDIYVTATSENLIKKLVNFGGKPLKTTELPGIIGVLLGLAKLKSLNGIGIIKPSKSLVLDREAGESAFNFLVKALNLKRKM
ncbi:MAG: PAC2 family protein [Candidatus Bathyarchaeia archaeon]|nr:PAC2 family protein [Candidatus Bathyarchaeota archaeon]